MSVKNHKLDDAEKRIGDLKLSYGGVTLVVESTMNLKAYIRDIPDFPKPGILFKDITPLLQLKSLKEVTLEGNKVSATDIEKLKKTLPKGCYFKHD